MNIFYRLAADVIVIFHLAYVAFVVVGLLAILLGVACRWGWVRNFWFRSLHLAAILAVVAEALWGITCPLTVWEQQLRTLAGQATYQGDFIAAVVHRLLFFDFEPWIFTLCYTLFGLAVLATFAWAPPRWPRKRPDA
jgi:hypothetical protein